MCTIAEDISDPWEDDSHIDVTELEKILDQPEPNESLQLHKDGQFEGFDGNVGDTWIYPNNLPCRSYQHSITQAALYRNTLVVLPTGLGKTFIAAVVMFNFYRWYPKGKVIFMAPTRPLVAQQIRACQKIMAFPVQDTVDITGKLRREKRTEYWRSKRVFFVTPQVLQADMVPHSELDEPFPFKDIKLLVVDEAHKAKGRYAYTEVAQMLWKHNRYFRMLGLSATPGRTMDDIAEVVRNLFISHIEVRWENSIDVVPYIHRRSMKTVVVELGEKIKEVREELVKIIDPYLRQLIEAGVLSGSHHNMSRNFLLFEQKRFRERSLHERHPEQSAVVSNFSICVSLFHSLELLERHGLRVFVNNFEEDDEGRQKFILTMNPFLRELVSRLREEMGPNPFDISAHAMTNGCLPEMPPDLDFGHPKFERARECLLEHFEKSPDSRAIVFCEYRESVMLIYRLLLQHSPKLKPRCFVGQGGSTGPLRALSQKQQMQIMNDFRSGKSNVLIATSIAEEGIDVGEVDLILCFDISTSNPTRFIQRIGRTGRQRRGNVVMLVTEGKEKQILQDVLANKDQTNKKIMLSSVVRAALYRDSPRLVPAEYSPKCVQTFIRPLNEDEVEDKEKVDGSANKKRKKTEINRKEKKIASKNGNTNQKIKGTQDLRTFFNKPSGKVDKDGIDNFLAPFCSTPVLSQRTAERTMEKVKNLFKGLNVDLNSPNTQLLATESPIKCNDPKIETPKRAMQPGLDTKEFKKLNRLLRSANDLVPLSQRGDNLLEQLKSESFSRSGKLWLLKRRYLHVRDLFEKMDILTALEVGDDMSTDEQEIRETCQHILSLFGDREALERFLDDAEYESKEKCRTYIGESNEYDISESTFERAINKIFSGLDSQGLSWDSFDYRQEELQKTKTFKEFMSKHNAKTKEENIGNMLNSVVFDKNTIETTTQFDEITITDSKYCSQWTQSLGNKNYDGTTFPSLRDKISINEKNQIKEPNITNSIKKGASESKLPSTRLQSKPTSLSGPLMKAFERQKEKEYDFRKKLDVEFSKQESSSKPVVIEIDSDDDFTNGVSLKNESKSKTHNRPCNTIIDVRGSPTKSTSFMKNEEHQEDLSSLKPSQAIEESFMLRQQSTPIPNKSCASSSLPGKEDPLMYSLEIDMDDFLDPLPEELELLPRRPESLSGSSLKENNKPNEATTQIRYTSNLFDLLEAKPTNSLITPKLTSKKFKPNTNLTPNTLQKSSELSPKKSSSPIVQLDSPKNRASTKLATENQETSPCFLRNYIDGLKQLRSTQNTSCENSFHQSKTNISKRISPTQDLDSPILRKPFKDNNLKRKILESETESEGKPHGNVNEKSDSDLEEITATQLPKRRRLTQRGESRLRRARLCPFFDQEAEKSGVVGHTSEEDDGEDTDTTLANFVCDSVIVGDDDIEEHDDEDDDRPTGTQMQAVYLQSVKSPYQRRGAFKIPEARQFLMNEDIYSQPLPIEESQYADDSFVVNEGEVTVQTTLCPLERAEKILRERRRKRKESRFAEVIPGKKRLRKCYRLQDDSDTSDGIG